MFPIDFFWRAAERWPDRTAIDAPEGAIRYDALAERVAELAAGLTALDPAPQSRVGICAGNSADHIAALLLCWPAARSGCRSTPKSTRSEIRRIIDCTLHPGVRRGLCRPARRCPRRPRAQLRGGRRRCGHGLAKDWPRPMPAQLLLRLPGDATQAIKFTGGTTGAPKGVMQPYRATANITNQMPGALTENERCTSSLRRRSRTAPPPTSCPSWRRAAAMWCWPRGGGRSRAHGLPRARRHGLLHAAHPGLHADGAARRLAVGACAA